MSDHQHETRFQEADPADNRADTRAALALIVIAVAGVLYYVSGFSLASLL